MSERPRKIRAGLYEHRGRLIVRTDWDGPRGGTKQRWELADYDGGDVVIEGLDTYPTLRAAADAIWVCEWFALCDRPATGTMSHPVLGEVPICDRCRTRVEDVG